MNFLDGMKVGVKGALYYAGLYPDDAYDEGLADSSSSETVTETTMQVVAIGMGRTGTTSLALALENIGYTVFHDDEVRAPLLSVDLRSTVTPD